MKLVSEKMNKVAGSCFEEGEELVACVSGGADSMALLGCLMSCGKNLKIIVAHFNHKLRGAESDEDESFVRNWCVKKRLKFVCRGLNIAEIAKVKKISTELAGRLERYRFFEEFGRTIVTAHTLSDRVETLLFNLTRGTSLKGLCSIPGERCKIKRPLICFSRTEIEAYCKENNLPFRNDSSNFSLAYSRNRIRHRVVPELKVLNGKFEFNVLNTILCLQRDESYFSEIVSAFLKKWFVNGKLNVTELSLQHSSIKSRVVVEFLRQSGVESSFDLVERILRLMEKGGFKISVPGLKILQFDGLFLSFASENRLCYSEFDFVLPKSIEYSYKNLVFIRTKISDFNYFLAKLPYLFLFKFDYDKIKGLIHIRSRIDGDRIKLPNRPTKKLKSLFQELKIPVEKRNGVVVLADDVGPFWVYGFGGDVRVLVDNGTENVVLVLKKNESF